MPIPGTTKRHRLEENIGAGDIQLTADDLREIDRAASQIEVHGARYPEHLQKMGGRETPSQGFRSTGAAAVAPAGHTA